MPAPPPLDLMLSPATMAATRRQIWWAVGVCLAAAVATAAFMPMAASEWPKLAGFVPAYGTAVAFAYLATAYLLFAQFRTTGTTALVFLAGGCLYTALILLAQLLSFAGLFAPQPILSGGSQTTIWLWGFWHLGPPLYTLAFALHERHGSGKAVEPEARLAVLAWTCGIVAVALGTSLVAVTVFHDAMPVLDRGGSYVAMNANGVAPAIQALTAVALLVLWRATRFRTVLQVWMGVAAFALLLDNTITMMGGARFTVGWYVGRLNALLSALVLFAVYLRHIGVLQARLAEAAVALAGDNERLEVRVAERTHELTQAVEEKEKALAAAERANAAKSRFFASASHDLRQPFQSLRLYHHLLAERRGQDDAKLLGGLDAAIAAGEELLHTLLEVSSLDAGIVKSVPRRVRLDEILEAVVLDSRGTAEEAGIMVRCRRRPLWVETDPVLLKRVIRNLVANAIRYNRPNGKVLLACRLRSGQALVQVWDTGIGIPADRMDEIFEDYVQLDNPERDRRKGLGLGLSIVRRTVDKLGCDLHFRSVEGRGTVFTVSLPLAETAYGVAASASAPVVVTPRADDLILVVEDDRLQALALDHLLQGWGYRTVRVTAAQEALDYLSTAAMLPTLVITDLRLPGSLNGLQLVDHLRQAMPARLPAIIVTGDTDPTCLKAVRAADCHVLHKPYRPNDLRRAVIAVMEGRSPVAVVCGGAVTGGASESHGVAAEPVGT